MPRTKPITRIDVIGSFERNPQDYVAEYYYSRNQKPFFVKPPNWDSVEDSIELLFIHNTSEHDKLIKLQNEMTESLQFMKIRNGQRIDQMYKIQDRLRNRFIKVNSFLKDCADKKRIAQETVDQESKQHANLTKEIDECKTALNTLTAFHTDLKNTLNSYKIYEEVLNEVITKSDIYKSLQDCVDRCDALMLAQVEIHNLEQKKIIEIEEMRKRMLDITNDAALKVLGLKNELARLERSYNETKALVMKWEKILGQAKDIVSENNMIKELTLEAILNIHKVLVSRGGTSVTFSRDQVEEMMDYIKLEIELLRSVQDHFMNEAAGRKINEKTDNS